MVSQRSPWLSTNLSPASHEITFLCLGPNSLKRLAPGERLPGPKGWGRRDTLDGIWGHAGALCHPSHGVYSWWSRNKKQRWMGGCVRSRMRTGVPSYQSLLLLQLQAGELPTAGSPLARDLCLNHTPDGTHFTGWDPCPRMSQPPLILPPGIWASFQVQSRQMVFYLSLSV